MELAGLSHHIHNPHHLTDEQLADRLTQARTAFRVNNFPLCIELCIEIASERPLANHPVELIMEDAVATYRRVDCLQLIALCLEQTPNDPRLFQASSTLLVQLGRHDEALEALDQALAIRPNNHTARVLQAIALFDAGRIGEAITLARELAKDVPHGNGEWSNLASMLVADGQFDEALAHYQRAIRFKPDDARIRLNYSIGLLKAGRYAQGWVEHEWRLHLPDHSPLPLDRILPNITPDLDLRGKRVLVTQEEGLGDTLMYLRYLAPLARLGANVQVWGAETLRTLTARIEGVSCAQTGGDVPDYDYHCPFISLPRAFSATPQPFGNPVPYLTPDPAAVQRWAERLEEDRALRVGVVWAGAPRPENSGAYMVDRWRSMKLAALEPLAKLKGVTLYSLQKGDASQQITRFAGPIVNVMDEMRDMDDTAALIANLDVVVSVDTSIVHLAGGLGRDVILMDRLNNCWRWLSGREDTPWYPQLRIIRQKHHDDWPDVVKRVAADLRKRVASRKS